MKGMRSQLVRERLTRFAADQRDQTMEIVSYDVAGHDNSTAVAISHYIFGRTDRVRVNGGCKEYRYPGLIEKDGIVWLGQSVFLLTTERSMELRGFLDSKGVAYGQLRVRTT